MRWLPSSSEGMIGILMTGLAVGVGGDWKNKGAGGADGSGPAPPGLDGKIIIKGLLTLSPLTFIKVTPGKLIRKEETRRGK